MTETATLAEAVELLKRIDETGLLFRHHIALDAEVAGFLHRQAEARPADVERAAWEAGFSAGFSISGEGWNGEYPFGDNDQDPTQDESWHQQREIRWLRYMKRDNSERSS